MTQSSPNSLPVSVEFFPPKTPEGVEKLAAVRQQLYAIRPEYCSVTYGAGGSTQEGTLQAVRAILSEGCDAAPHFSCIGASKASVRAELAQFRAEGIQPHRGALRGDMPSGYGGLAASSATPATWWRLSARKRAITSILKWPPTPRNTPQAKSPMADLEAFAAKVKAGANSGHHAVFLQQRRVLPLCGRPAEAWGWRCRWCRASCPSPARPSCMRFSDACGAEIPRWIRMRLQAFGDDTASIKAFGLDVVTDLCDQLRHAGVPGIHFYTMNQAAPVLAICARLGLTPA
jgi:methylenetetrahydrofolate reductase (NADPH)